MCNFFMKIKVGNWENPFFLIVFASKNRGKTNFQSPKIEGENQEKSFEKFRSFEHSLSETELANVCQKVLPKFGRTEFSVYH